MIDSPSDVCPECNTAASFTEVGDPTVIGTEYTCGECGATVKATEIERR